MFTVKKSGQVVLRGKKVGRNEVEVRGE